MPFSDLFDQGLSFWRCFVSLCFFGKGKGLLEIFLSQIGL